MRYKTITLEHLKADPARYRHLRRTRTLMAELARQAAALKSAHMRWQERLVTQRPDLDPTTVTTTALEFALAEWEDRLVRPGSSAGSPPVDG